MSEDARVIGTFNDYHGLLEALRLRAHERKVALSGDDAAVVAGLPHKYLAKLIGSNPVRRIGMTSLGAVLGVLAVKCILVEDPDADKWLQKQAARFGKGLKQRNENLVRDDATHRTFTHRFMRKIGKKGGRARALKLTSKQRKASARKAALVRWADVKEAVKP
jgi:hypothetical protein